VNATIAVLPGDGIGPEVTAAAVRLLTHVAEAAGHSFRFMDLPIGGASLESSGTPLTGSTLAACRGADAILLGAVGGPRWDRVEPDRRPEQGLLRLRKELGLFANLRPVRPHPALAAASPVRAAFLSGVDLLVVRELTGGVYFGRPRFREERDGTVLAVDTVEYTVREIRRVAELAFRLAEGRRHKVTSIDKANVLETSRLWRETVTAVAAGHPEIQLEHMLVDTAAMKLISAPASFDVVVTENMFGDILTDEAAVLVGSLGLLPSASLGEGRTGLYEPIHGSAPDIAGSGRANPLGAILSGALLLRHSLGLEREATQLEAAVAATLQTGPYTPDLGGTARTTDITEAVVERLIVVTSARQGVL
jgi:3-isopropylmalate dehydrogenase